ncbi:MAG TPA: hypothetical protein VJ970_00320, partial [Flavobacteriaceae bacterium]|nr:hypothetical protein [Flavobacteriaceae bacterium]
MKYHKFISTFFHPINFPLIGTLLYLLFVPRFINKTQEYTILLLILIGTYIFPFILLYLMKRFKMIESYYMKNVEERKFPLLMFIAISFIIANWLLKAPNSTFLALFYIAYGIGLVLAYLLLYAKFKISLHTSAIGGLIGFLLCFSYFFKLNFLIFIALLVILAGMVGT